MQRKDFVVEKLIIFSYGSQRVRVLINKGYRAHTMLETLNSLPRELQWVDINTIYAGFKCMRLLHNQQETMRLNIRCAKMSVQNWPHPRIWTGKDCQ